MNALSGYFSTRGNVVKVASISRKASSLLTSNPTILNRSWISGSQWPHGRRLDPILLVLSLYSPIW